MQESPHPLTDSRLRIDRACEHLAHLRDLVRDFEREQYRGLRVTPLTPEGDFEFTPTPSEIPRRANILVGEVVYNLRAALDYLVWAAAFVNEGHEVEGTQFPIDSDPDDFEGRVTMAAKKKKGFLAGVPGDLISAIRQVQPFKGVEWTKRLRDLSNPDKHRKLTTLAGRGEATAEATHTEPVTLADGSEGHTIEYRSHLTVRFLLPDGADVVETLDVLQSEVRAFVEQFDGSFESTRVP